MLFLLLLLGSSPLPPCANEINRHTAARGGGGGQRCICVRHRVVCTHRLIQPAIRPSWILDRELQRERQIQQKIQKRQQKSHSECACSMRQISSLYCGILYYILTFFFLLLLLLFSRCFFRRLLRAFARRSDLDLGLEDFFELFFELFFVLLLLLFFELFDLDLDFSLPWMWDGDGARAGGGGHGLKTTAEDRQVDRGPSKRGV